MISSLRKFLLTAVIITLLHSNAPAGDLPTPETCIEVEIEHDTGNVIDTHLPKNAEKPLLDEATIKELRKWRFKPGKVRDETIPIPLAKGRSRPSWS